MQLFLKDMREGNPLIMEKSSSFKVRTQISFLPTLGDSPSLFFTAGGFNCFFGRPNSFIPEFSQRSPRCTGSLWSTADVFDSRPGFFSS